MNRHLLSQFVRKMYDTLCASFRLDTLHFTQLYSYKNQHVQSHIHTLIVIIYIGDSRLKFCCPSNEDGFVAELKRKNTALSLSLEKVLFHLIQLTSPHWSHRRASGQFRDLSRQGTNLKTSFALMEGNKHNDPDSETEPCGFRPLPLTNQRRRTGSSPICVGKITQGDSSISYHSGWCASPPLTYLSSQ